MLKYGPFPVSVRSAAILTTGYVAGTVIDEASHYNQCDLEIAFTKGSLTSLEIKIETSIDGVTYYPETNASISGGTTTLTPGEYTTTTDGNFKINVPISTAHIKVSFKGTGTVTGSSVACRGILSEV